MDRTPKTKPVVEEFDYSDFYDDVSLSTVTSGPNVTEYEVRLPLGERKRVGSVCWVLSPPLCDNSAGVMCVGQIIEYEDFDNTTNTYEVNEYEYEEENERYGPAERERELSLNAEVAR